MDYRVIASTVLYPEIIETKNGGCKVLDTHKNLEFLLKHFKIDVKHNLMSRRREIIIPNHFVFEDDIENDSLARIEYLATLNFMPTRQIDKFLDMLAAENAYHPIIESIQSKQWDGIERLHKFIKTIKTESPVMDYELIKTWMVAAVAAAFSKKGFTNHGVLVIQGVQGIGKTEWVKSLDPTNGGAVKVGVLLDPKNKDSVIGANRFWLIELGELDATLNKTDIAHLKSYITSSADDIRVPWGRKETHLVRRTAYVATVNEKNFLVDTTGNRRWWTITALAINYEHGFDMQQVWSEVYQLWLKGALTYLEYDLQDKVNIRNRDYEKIDPFKEKLLTNYDWSTPRRRALTTGEILDELDYLKPTTGECMRMSKILTDINGKEAIKRNGKRLHEVPEKLIGASKFRF